MLKKVTRLSSRLACCLTDMHHWTSIVCDRTVTQKISKQSKGAYFPICTTPQPCESGNPDIASFHRCFVNKHTKCTTNVMHLVTVKPVHDCMNHRSKEQSILQTPVCSRLWVHVGPMLNHVSSCLNSWSCSLSRQQMPSSIAVMFYYLHSADAIN